MEQQRANVFTPLAPIVFGPGTRTVYLSCAKMAAPLGDGGQSQSVRIDQEGDCAKGVRRSALQGAKPTEILARLQREEGHGAVEEDCIAQRLRALIAPVTRLF